MSSEIKKLFPSMKLHSFSYICCDKYGLHSILTVDVAFCRGGNGMKYFIVICFWWIVNIIGAIFNFLTRYVTFIHIMIMYNSFHFQRTRENFRSIHRLHNHSFSDHLLISFARITIPLPTLHLQHLNIQVTQTYTL